MKKFKSKLFVELEVDGDLHDVQRVLYELFIQELNVTNVKIREEHTLAKLNELEFGGGNYV